MPLAKLPTPTALIDEARLMHNIQHLQQRLQSLGVRLLSLIHISEPTRPY